MSLRTLANKMKAYFIGPICMEPQWVSRHTVYPFDVGIVNVNKCTARHLGET